MDGVRLIRILFLLVFFAAQTANSKNAPHCAWSTSNPAAESKLLKIQIQKFQSINLTQESCPLSESFDESSRSLHMGALQALAIAKQSCDVKESTDADHSDFLFQALRLQGFKLAQNPQMNLKRVDTDPNYLFQSSGLDCFAAVGTDPARDENKLRAGDLLVSKSDLMVIDQVKDDPFSIKTKIDANKKIIEFIAQGLDTSERVCGEWMSDPLQFKISVLSHVGRSPMFPKFGMGSSIWVTAITERAVRECTKAIADILPPPQTRRLASVSDGISSDVGVKALRFRTEVPACRLKHDKIPNFKDLDCVQFCDFGAEASK